MRIARAGAGGLIYIHKPHSLAVDQKDRIGRCVQGRSKACQLFRPLALGDVAHDAHENWLGLAGQVDFPNRDQSGKNGAIPTYSGQFTRFPKQARHAGKLVPGQVSVVFGAVGLRHQDLDVLPDQLLRGPAKHGLNRIARG